MSKTDAAYFGDMLIYARRAHGKVAGISREDFDADDNLQFALAYLIMIIGEAASRLSQSARAALPELPWGDIIGMRHRLVHGYGLVDIDVVWDSANNDLPNLIAVLEKRIPTKP